MSFSKSWNCTSCFGECNFSFLKNSQVQINFKLNKKKSYDYLLIIQTWKNVRGKIAGRCFLKPFFSHSKKLFSEFLYKIFVIGFWYHWLTKFLIVFLSIINPELRCVICAGTVLHLNCTALSQSESSNFLMCIIAYTNKRFQAEMAYNCKQP